jgi:anti-sigma factor RsiW
MNAPDTENEMTCREFVEAVTEYLEGALTDARRAELHEHINECGGCSTYLDQMRQTIAALGGLGRNGDHLETRAAALAAFRQLHGGSGEARPHEP